MTEQELTTLLGELLAMPAETEVLEFKEAKNSYDFTKLGKYFSALSNEANLKGKPYAWLVFGVNNNHKIVSTKFRANNRADLDHLKSEIAQKINSRINFVEIYELNSLPEGRVVMFQIPAAPQGIPVSFEGHYYGRDGEELSALNIEEMERIRKQIIQTDWSAMICNGASINDLDDTAVIVARQNFAIKNPRLREEIPKWDTITFLNKAKLAIKGGVTNAAILLLGKPESDHFIAPAIARITWVLKNLNNEEKDYEHFECPLLLSADKVFAKIRNLKYRYIGGDTLFPEEIDRYDAYIIREALNNCIAHQDYTLLGRINVVEIEDEQLIFSNMGDFLPNSIEAVLESDQPPTLYRNSFLVQAMVNLNMIDTVGSGIKRMFRSQSKRFFPMPDYDLSNRMVKLVIIGKVLNIDYARVLARNPDLSLEDIMLLDKVQKNKILTDVEANHLRNKKLIEGRKPNYTISENLAIKTKQVGDYLKKRGFDNEYYKKLTFEFIQKNPNGSTKEEIRDLLMEKLPDKFEKKQKETKISTILTQLKREDKIKNIGSDAKPNWVAK